MRYLILRRREDLQELGYRIYISDAVRIACENTARIGGGSTLSKRWADTLESQNKRVLAHDTRSPQEIVADIAEKAGLTITHEHI